MCEHRVVISNGELVCARCGLVLGPALSFLPERGDGGAAFRAEAGSRHDRDLGTEIYPLPQTLEVSPRVRRWWGRVRRYLQSRPAGERRLIETLCCIDRICGYMGLPRGVRDSLSRAAKRLAGRMRGSSRLRALVLMTYLACERHGVPRELKDIDRAFQDLFGSEYARVRDRRLDRASGPADLSASTQARIPELERALGFG